MNLASWRGPRKRGIFPASTPAAPPSRSSVNFPRTEIVACTRHLCTSSLATGKARHSPPEKNPEKVSVFGGNSDQKINFAINKLPPPLKQYDINYERISDCAGLIGCLCSFPSANNFPSAPGSSASAHASSTSASVFIFRS